MGHLDPLDERRKPWIETPLIESAALSKVAGCRVFLKLELLQPAGSFKTRGIGNLILSALTDPANHGKKLHFFSSSGGNAGLAAIVAARDFGCPCTVVVPVTSKLMMIRKLLDAGAADVIQQGASWFEADTHLRNTFIDNPAESGSAVKNIYVPPFDHPEIWRGAGTMIDEIAAQLPPREHSGSRIEQECPFPADVIACSVGGGGLFNGVIDGLDRYLRTHQPENSGGSREVTTKKVRVLAVETKGADSLALSLLHGNLTSLPAITSLATSLGALCVAPQTLKNAQVPPPGIGVTSVVGTDAEAAKGVLRLSDELRLQVELGCGISVEMCVAGRLKELVKDLSPNTRVVVIVCGGNGITAETIAEYRRSLENGWE